MTDFSPQPDGETALPSSLGVPDSSTAFPKAGLLSPTAMGITVKERENTDCCGKRQTSSDGNCVHSETLPSLATFNDSGTGVEGEFGEGIDYDEFFGGHSNCTEDHCVCSVDVVENVNRRNLTIRDEHPSSPKTVKREQIKTERESPCHSNCPRNGCMCASEVYVDAAESQADVPLVKTEPDSEDDCCDVTFDPAILSKRENECAFSENTVQVKTEVVEYGHTQDKTVLSENDKIYVEASGERFHLLKGERVVIPTSSRLECAAKSETHKAKVRAQNAERQRRLRAQRKASDAERHRQSALVLKEDEVKQSVRDESQGDCSALKGSTEKADVRAQNAERQRRKRASMLEEEKAEVRAKHAEHARQKRALMSDEERAKQRAKNAEQARQRRAFMSEEERVQDRARNAERKRIRRELMSEEERVKQRAKRAERARQRRAFMSEEERVKRRARNTETKRIRRVLMSKEDKAEQKARANVRFASLPEDKRAEKVLTEKIYKIKRKQKEKMRTAEEKAASKMYQFNKVRSAGLSHQCFSCHRLQYRNQVLLFSHDKFKNLPPDMLDAIVECYTKTVKKEPEYVCLTCRYSLKSGQWPTLCPANPFGQLFSPELHRNEHEPQLPDLASDDSKKRIQWSGSSYACKTCSATFSKAKSLAAHMFIHTGKMPNCLTHNCRICGLKCGNPKSLSKHIQEAHRENCRYLCDYCGQMFLGVMSLYLHLKLHARKQSYVCEICAASFQHQSHLSIHKQVHSVESPYPCPVCNRRFKQSAGLNHHMKVHTRQNSHSCQLCSETFKSISELQVHCSTMHGVIETAPVVGYWQYVN